MTPVTSQGILYASILLYPTQAALAAAAFLTARTLDPYIQEFASVSTFSPYAVINPRPITRVHLWLAFALPVLNRVRRVCTADFSVLCQSRRLRSVSSNAVSGGAFQGVTPSFHSSEYQLERRSLSVTFTSLQDFSHVEFICGNVSLHGAFRQHITGWIYGPPGFRLLCPKSDPEQSAFPASSTACPIS